MARRKTKKKAVTSTPVDDSQFNKPIIQGKIVSNYYGGQWIDRLYSTGFGDAKKHYLINNDSTEYQGKITQTSRRMKNMNGDSYRQILFKTADGRWFDNGGMPCEKPHHEPKDPNIEEDDE